ncbi:MULTISPECIES: sugar kinase [unclassified Lentimonas]|uniref:sugar kinase n=1 Tax=unclassified Lentimonas TaxID=2630993 RepID=UPI00132C1DE1|nr:MULTISPECIES: sugar kinase [unclassified Lentimonas]CAA6679630.1 2-dehydro-3-deoxygluconate kinase (EC [Lentimonas sp. CC4]CAA6683603.1 2-dehydro-3-deoxygluconate kinase (EC [Lentimonas sp. CC6]CAA6690685.1 2-dehydro-3-deoxygluconate kinase (EC [Lentimonas sp. CC19]CAA6693386.1 2-dehydro-3-deoxygluconate kinase (EC [Lentimonas sp. CC10]CAA7071851.1 2-dehydro-3-deoxygluconate kinase (EC [Lentimonas sp. CC11]
MSNIVVTFGEIMGRIAAPENLRLRQTRTFDVTYAGAEASVAASICNFGGKARYVTALPKHSLAEATMDSVRAVGIDAQYILRTDKGRLGLYFLETGANQRPSNVVYDRADSAIAITPAEQYDWESIFDGASWLHLSGITPALSANAAAATLVAAQKAKAAGAQVSIDLNFRGKLWDWDSSKTARELAQETMRKILPFVDVVIANEEDCHDVLGIRAGDTDVHSGALDTSRYPDVARQVVQQFPNISKVAITLRESYSATHNNWGAMLFDAASDKAAFAPLDADGNYQSYEIKNIVDRVGGGDSFAGGLIFALTTPELSEPQTAVKYAVAASCLKHSIKGDFNFSTRSEVEALMGGSASGRVVR